MRDDVTGHRDSLSKSSGISNGSRAELTRGRRTWLGRPDVVGPDECVPAFAMAFSRSRHLSIAQRIPGGRDALSPEVENGRQRQPTSRAKNSRGLF